MLKENISSVIAAELNIKASQVEATVKLLDEGNTIPFIARYRKEATGGLDEEQILYIEKQYKYWLANAKDDKDYKKIYTDAMNIHLSQKNFQLWLTVFQFVNKHRFLR